MMAKLIPPARTCFQSIIPWYADTSIPRMVLSVPVVADGVTAADDVGVTVADEVMPANSDAYDDDDADGDTFVFTDGLPDDNSDAYDDDDADGNAFVFADDLKDENRDAYDDDDADGNAFVFADGL